MQGKSHLMMQSSRVGQGQKRPLRAKKQSSTSSEIWTRNTSLLFWSDVLQNTKWELYKVLRMSVIRAEELRVVEQSRLLFTHSQFCVRRESFVRERDDGHKDTRVKGFEKQKRSGLKLRARVWLQLRLENNNTDTVMCRHIHICLLKATVSVSRVSGIRLATVRSLA